MTRPDQKIEEIRAVERMRQILEGFPPGHVEPADAPDVLVISDHNRTGIEVTELHQRPTSRHHQESERAGIARRARELAETCGMAVADVVIHFNESVPLVKRDREIVARRLVDIVATNLPQSGDALDLEMWRVAGIHLPWVRRVRVQRSDVLTAHRWAVPESGRVRADFVPELQRAIDDKNITHWRYRQHCDDCWLLIVASGSRPSGLFEPSDVTRSHVYESAFARTFFMEAFGGEVVELSTTAA